MSIDDFPEKEIRQKIINKINPTIPPGNRSKHKKGKVFSDNKVVARVKIPNNHPRIMKQSKSKFIASALKLNHKEFNDLINCPLSGPVYYKKLKAATSK